MILRHENGDKRLVGFFARGLQIRARSPGAPGTGSSFHQDQYPALALGARKGVEGSRTVIQLGVRYLMKSWVSCLVIGPGLPLPTGRLSISVMGTISAAVPVPKHSWAM